MTPPNGEKRISGAELQEAMATNFEGQHGEEVRQLLLNKAPKFGNDDDYVDLLAEMDVLAVLSNCPEALNNATGMKPTPIRVVVYAL